MALAPYFMINDISIPLRIDGYEYWFDRGSDHGGINLYRRRPESPSKSESLITEEQLRAYFGTNTISNLRISPNHSHLAFTLSQYKGLSDKLIIWPINKSGNFIVGPDQVHDFQWGSDERSLVYSRREELRANSIWHLSLEDESSNLLLLSNEIRANFIINRSTSNKFIIIKKDDSKCSEISIINLSDQIYASNNIKFPEINNYYTDACLNPDLKIDHANDRFYAIFKNNTKPDHLISWPERCSDKCDYQSEYYPGDKEQIDKVQFNKDSLVILSRIENRPKLIVKSTNSITELPLDSALTKILLLSEKDNEGSLRFSGEGPYTPPSLFEWRHNLSDPVIIQSPKIPTEINRPLTDYELERITVPAQGDILIPITVRFLRSKTNSNSPLILNSYGAYGFNNQVTYSAYEKFLLDRGYILVTAHIRGGGELGARWHHSATGINKINSVNDLITAARSLVDKGYSQHDKIILSGRSAGGLVAASALLKQPDLFGFAILDRPFLDPRLHASTNFDSLSARELPEWGDPADPEIDLAFKDYSPMEIPIPNKPPPILINAALKDKVIPLDEITNWVDRFLVCAQKGCNIPYVNLSPSGTHDGEIKRFREVDEFAFTIAYTESKLNLNLD